VNNLPESSDAPCKYCQQGRAPDRRFGYWWHWDVDTKALVSCTDRNKAQLEAEVKADFAPTRRTFRVGPFRESRDIGVVWPVLEDHGKCDCGACDLTSPVAFFIDSVDAEKWVSERNGQ
jgi:hypothetical protein